MIRNETEIRLFGLKRSGNHPIVVWITAQYPKPVYFLNNIAHFTDPFVTHYDWRQLPNCVYIKKKSLEIRRLENKQCLFYSYEDMDISLLKDKPLLEDKEAKLGKSGREYNLLLIRDPFNLMASRYEKHKIDSRMEATPKTLNLWKVYAKEYLGQTNYLKHKAIINFNQWFTDIEYRKNLSKQLDLNFSDKGLDIIPETGEGSSFEGRAYDGKAQQMKMNDRWRFLIKNKQFISLFNDLEIFKLSKLIFKDSIKEALEVIEHGI